MNYKFSGNYEDLRENKSNFVVIAIEPLGLPVQKALSRVGSVSVVGSRYF